MFKITSLLLYISVLLGHRIEPLPTDVLIEETSYEEVTLASDAHTENVS